MPSTSTPRWAIPFLSAYLVANAQPHYLRQLDHASFRCTARACDIFTLATTLPLLFVALVLLPGRAAFFLLIFTSCWGMVVLVLVGRRVGSERKRRRLLAR